MAINPKRIHGIKKLIDRGGELRDRIKADNVELESIKILIRRHAAYRKSNEIQGNEYKASATTKTCSSISAREAYFALEHDIEKFIKVVNVSVPLFREVIGTKRSELFIDVDEEEFKVIGFKKISG